MEFKFGGDRIEILPQRDGSTFIHEGMMLHMGDELWLELDGRKHKATATKVGDVWWVHVLGHTLQFEVIEPGAVGSDDDKGLTAPMPGKILEVHVKVGQTVSAGETLMIMEAMKMESEVKSPTTGKISELYVSTGDTVQAGEPLLTISN